MRFSPPLVEGRFLRRYKRFLVDVALPDGTVVTAHSTNTGSLQGCLAEGAKVLLAPAANPDRKLKWTWIMIRTPSSWVGVDTSLAVPLVEEAMDTGLLPELTGFPRRVREVKYGRTGESRIDILLSRGGEAVAPTRKGGRGAWRNDERVYVEVKNTTLALDRDGERVAAFPDAVTERGLKHLLELEHVVKQGHRACVVFCSQRSDGAAFVPADDIHPEYGKTLRRVAKTGVEFYALGAKIGPKRLALAARLEVRT